MARTAQETAIILKKLYRKGFGGDYLAPFRLNWEQLRGIAGVRRLSGDFLEEVNGILQAGDYSLLTLNNFFILAKEGDFGDTRALTARLAEQYLPDSEKEDDSDEVQEPADLDQEDS